MPYRLKIVFILLAFAAIYAETPAFSEQNRPPSGVGFDERLGDFIPLDLTFTDEQGREVILRELINKPTILVFVYHSCSHTCPLLLAGLSEVLSRLELSPGRDFNILTVSFDVTDTPAVAAGKKKDYIKAAGREFPERSWNFLVGSEEMIGRLTSAAGFRFSKTSNGFTHPVALIMLSPKGRITRYLYGITFLPVDVTLALTEASKGLPVPTVNKLLLYCYSYDPEGKRYVLDILKITAAATLLFILVFIGWLTLSGRKDKAKS